MRTAVAGKPAVDFPKPEEVVTATIDPETGELAAPDCPETREEFFIAGSEPTTYCSKHGGEGMAPVTKEPFPEKEPAEQNNEGDATEGETDGSEP